MVRLPPLTNAPGFLDGINDNGQIIGTSFFGSPDFVYDLSSDTVTPINYPGATHTSLISINDNGDILGGYNSSGPTNYFIYDAGLFTPLSFPAGCTADGINDTGQIIGNCFNSGVSEGVVDNAGTITYINYNGNSDQNDTLITGINDSGEIVGMYYDVPEPSALLQLATELVGLWLCIYFAKRRKLESPSSHNR